MSAQTGVRATQGGGTATGPVGRASGYPVLSVLPPFFFSGSRGKNSTCRARWFRKGPDPSRTQAPGPANSRASLLRVRESALTWSSTRGCGRVPGLPIPVAGGGKPNPNRARTRGGAGSLFRVRGRAVSNPPNPSLNHQPEQLAQTACACLRFGFGFPGPRPGATNRARVTGTQSAHIRVHIFAPGRGQYPRSSDGTRAFLRVHASSTLPFHMPFKVHIQASWPTGGLFQFPNRGLTRARPYVKIRGIVYGDKK